MTALAESPVNMPSPTKEKNASLVTNTVAPKKFKMMCPECLEEGGVFIASGDGHRCGDCGRQAKYWDLQGREVSPEIATKETAAEPTGPDENSTDQLSEMIDSIDL